MGDTLREVRNRLLAGQQVLFSGTPCQTAGLSNYLGKDYENLLMVDVLCHGVPSPKPVSYTHLNKRSKKIINFFVIALLIFISGTRYYMGGSDVLVYENVYNRVPSVSTVLLYLFIGINQGVNTNYETGFILICAIIKRLGFSYFGFTLVFTTLFYLLKMCIRDRAYGLQPPCILAAAALQKHLAVCRLQRAAAGNVCNGFNGNVLHTGSDDF